MKPSDKPWPRAAQLRARLIVAALRPHAIERRRVFLHGSYAPSGLAWMGVPVPACRAVLRMAAGRLRDASAREVLAVVRALTRTRLIEARQVGYELIESRSDVRALLTRRIIESLGEGNDNWAAVDAFSVSVTGPAWLSGQLKDADLRQWARSPDRWWRRTALVSTVPLNLRSRGGSGDARRTLMICGSFGREAEPMLAKALSWALRLLVPHDPGAVRAYLAGHATTLPAVVVREVRAKMKARP